MNIRVSARDQLHPVMLPLLDELQRQAAASPLVGPTRLIETWRDPELQNKDFAVGRNERGEVIDPKVVLTWKRGGESWHNLTRWVRVCPDCPHLADRHLSSPAGAGAVRACVLCACAAFPERLMRGQLTRYPASCAFHLALEDDGDEQAGSLEGFGTNRLDPKDRARYNVLAEFAQKLGLRSGAPWGDYTHQELAGFPFAQVKAVLELQDGRLETMVRPLVV